MVAVFWYENNMVKWYLAIVDRLNKDSITLSYMTHADSTGLSWTFPEKADVLDMSYDQILESKVMVQYSGTVRIRCMIMDKTMVARLNGMVERKEI